MTEEGRLMREIELALSAAGARTIRVNAGQGWIGRMTKRPDGSITLAHPRPFHGVPEGVSDLIGWTADGRFLAVEVKTPKGRATERQLAFIEAVRRAGGVAGLARSVGEALALLG